jgi:hypothetical protein
MNSFWKTRGPVSVHLHFLISKMYRGLFHLSMLYYNPLKESTPLSFSSLLLVLSKFWIKRVWLLGDLGIYP